MRDYFGFNVKFVMNTTNIDDKIIVRSRQQYLQSRFKEEHATADGAVSEAVLREARAAFRRYIEKNLPSLPPDTAPEEFVEAVAKAHGEKQAASVTDGAANQNQAPTVDALLFKVHTDTARSAAEGLVTTRPFISVLLKYR